MTDNTINTINTFSSLQLVQKVFSRGLHTPVLTQPPAYFAIRSRPCIQGLTFCGLGLGVCNNNLARTSLPYVFLSSFKCMQVAYNAAAALGMHFFLTPLRPSVRMLANPI